MKVANVKDFKDGATRLLRGKVPILVTRRGRLAGVFFPTPGDSLPIELKREIFPLLVSQISRDLKRRGGRESDVLADFAAWRTHRRETGRRR